MTRLSGKNVFTLLDLKDGFRNIKIHSDHTSSFRLRLLMEFEYNHLPFGFCEAPAEFQRRIVQILQSLIREDKVIVYIDDILILSSTVEENLETLFKVFFLIFKQYSLEINFKKCSFLKKTIEYLGYIVPASGITLSSRHKMQLEIFRIRLKQ